MGGWLGQRLGLPITLAITAVVIVLGVLRLWLSPVRTWRTARGDTEEDAALRLPAEAH